MNHTRERYFEWTLLGLILILGGLLFFEALPFLNGALGAITLYFLLRRFNFYLSKNISPSLAPWIITLLVTIFVMIPLSAGLWYIIDLVQKVDFDVQLLVKRFTDTIKYVESKTQFNLLSENSVSYMTAKATQLVNMLMSGINNAAINLFTAILLLFFLLSGGIRMERAIARALPFSDNNKHAVITKVSTIVRSSAIGIPLLAIIQGAVAAVGYFICGVNSPVAFGVLTGFASMIPVVGSMLVWVPLSISQYFEQGMMPAIYLAAYGIIIISQCDNVLRMFVQKRLANIHPLITIFGVIAGLPLFGFMGLIFGPLLVAMFMLFLEMFFKQYIIGHDHNESITAHDGALGKKDGKDSTNAEHALSGKAAKAERRAERKAEKERRREERNALKAEQAQAQAGASSGKGSRNGRDSANGSGNSSGGSSLGGKSGDGRNGRNDSRDGSSGRLGDGRDGSKGSGRSSKESKLDFKSAKAENKQQKREAAKERKRLEETSSLSSNTNKSTNFVLPNPNPLNGNTPDPRMTDTSDGSRERQVSASSGDANINELLGKQIVSRAVNDVIRSFADLDDLDSHQGIGSLQGHSDFEKPRSSYRNKIDSAILQSAIPTPYSDEFLARRAALDALSLNSLASSSYKEESLSNVDGLKDKISIEGENGTPEIRVREKSRRERRREAREKNQDPSKKLEKKEKPRADVKEPRLSRRERREQGRRIALENAKYKGETIINPWDRIPSLDVEVPPLRSELKNALNNDSAHDANDIPEYGKLAPDLGSNSSESSTSYGDSHSSRADSDRRDSDRSSRDDRDSRSDNNADDGEMTRSERRERDRKERSRERERERDRSAAKSSSSEKSRKDKKSSKSSKSSREKERSRERERSSKSKESRRSERRRSESRSSRAETKSSRSRRRSESVSYSLHTDRSEAPIFTTVVSHKFGALDAPRSRSALKTQLVSVHTAKGTVMASREAPRRRPSKRRPRH